MREKVKFTEKTPVVIKLDFNDGTQCASRDGSVQYQYTVNDDAGIMYVDPAIRNYILAEGAKAGDIVRITKYGADARQWLVEKALNPVSGAAAFPPTAAAAKPAARPGAAQQPAPVEITPASLDLFAALKSAIDAAIEAERYAATQAHALLFSAEDIRTMANSIICRKAGR
jgi:hypothetical protein